MDSQIFTPSDRCILSHGDATALIPVFQLSKYFHLRLGIVFFRMKPIKMFESQICLFDFLILSWQCLGWFCAKCGNYLITRRISTQMAHSFALWAMSKNAYCIREGWESITGSCWETAKQFPYLFQSGRMTSPGTLPRTTTCVATILACLASKKHGTSWSEVWLHFTIMKYRTKKIVICYFFE